jgi:Zn-dependent protease with chaperone function
VISAAPTVLAIEGDSAWIVILAVSLVTLAAVLLVKRLINRPGGLASALLLSLPLVVPLIAALSFDQAVLPVVAVLRPIDNSLLERSNELLHFMLVSDEGRHVVTAYALTTMAGAWMLWIGVSVSSFMLVRRAIGMVQLRRLIRSCRRLETAHEGEIQMLVDRLCISAQLARPPRVLVMPPGSSGAFAVAGRRGRILISPQLLDELDHEELEGILAHEIAHLEARDVQVAFFAGFLRDLVAWNPIAHIALRRLLVDRELEADRRAATLTGNPLAVASGLVRLCELRPRRRARSGYALAFGEGRVTRRVGHLLALADGRTIVRGGGTFPYLVAGLLVALLGLQAGAHIADQDGGAFAFMLGSAAVPERGDFWSPRERAEHRRALKEERLQQGAIRVAAPEPPTGVSFKERFKSDWVKHWQHKVRRAGLTHEMQLWDIHPVNVFSNSFGFYRLELVPGAI